MFFTSEMVREVIRKILDHNREANQRQIEMWYGWLIDIYHRHNEIPSILIAEEKE